MEDLTVLQRGTYAQFKAQTDRELNNQAEGFVRLGYLFKTARDTTILYESGYQTVTEFAQKEYGLSKDIVSRYIRINDRYSEGGCSLVYNGDIEERIGKGGDLIERQADYLRQAYNMIANYATEDELDYNWLPSVMMI